MDYECLRNFLFSLVEARSRSSLSICTVSNYTFPKALMIYDERFSIAIICARKKIPFRRPPHKIRQFKEFFNYPTNGTITFLTSAILQNSALDEEFFNYNDTLKYWKRERKLLSF